MSTGLVYSSGIAFTPAVKAIQAGKGSRAAYARMEAPGFLRVIDDSTLGFADFAGNRQYITAGNLADNPKACLFLIDYARRRRIKIWGERRVPSKRSCSPCRPGMPIARSISRSASRPPTLRPCSPTATSGSTLSKPISASSRAHGPAGRGVFTRRG